MNDEYLDTKVHLSAPCALPKGVGGWRIILRLASISAGVGDGTGMESRLNLVLFCILPQQVYLCMKSLLSAAVWRSGYPWGGGRGLLT